MEKTDNPDLVFQCEVLSDYLGSCELGEYRFFKRGDLIYLKEETLFPLYQSGKLRPIRWLGKQALEMAKLSRWETR